jgi:hypothetical protein
VSNPIVLMLVFVELGSIYLYALVSSFRMSNKLRFSTLWLLLLLIGAAFFGIALAFSIPVMPASPMPFRLFALLAHLFNVLLIWAMLGKTAPENRLTGTLLYAWNPLVLIELAVNGSITGAVISLLLLAVWLSMQPVATPLVGIPSALPLQIRTETRAGRDAHKGRRYWFDIAALVLVGLAVRMSLVTLVIAPLFLWFMVRNTRDISTALMGFAWRALIVLAMVIVAYIPAWQGGATLLAFTDSLHLFNFAYSPLSLVVIPVRALYSLIANSAHFPPSLMQPTTAADMTVLATAFFLFAMLYFREMGRVRARTRSHSAKFYPPNAEMTRNGPSRPVGTMGGAGRMRGPCACPRGVAIRMSSRNPQQNEETPVIVQDKGVDVVHSYAYDGLFTSWTIVILGYIALASTVFWPGYVVWMVWVVALRRFDRLSVCAILLSCSALLYYPLLRLDPTPASILLPLCIFGIPLVYMIVQRSIPLGRVERKNVLT